MRGEAQVIFIDTPGIFTGGRRLEKSMVDAAWQGARDADIICLLVDAARTTINDETRQIIETLKQQKRKAVLVLNKIDLVEKTRLLDYAKMLNEYDIFEETFMISAEKGSGVKDFMAYISKQLPKSPFLYDPDMITDVPMRLFAAEITREKLFIQLQDELPYSVAVETENWENFQNGDIKVSMVVYVMRDSQKAIVLGKGGSRIKKIGQAVRKELSDLFETTVHVNIYVKTRKNWVEDPERYIEWGLDFNAGTQN
jgi:GTP-binding protein Era